MAQPKRRKLERPSNAAYAASQPLFDALRTGCTKVDEQQSNLTEARDLVQTLHVKITNSQLEAEKHERYVDCALNAWKSALDVYTDIFEELVKITAADPSEGKDAAQGHAQFKALASSVGKAKKTAATLHLHATKKPVSVHPTNLKETDQAASKPVADESKPNSQVKRSLPIHEQAEDAEDRSAHKAPRLSGVNASASKSGAAKTASGTSQGKAGRGTKSRQRQAKTLEGIGLSAESGSGPGKDETIRASRQKSDHDIQHSGAGLEARQGLAKHENKIPGVKYEDVSAEVGARLKAKADAKKAKKAAKKRKHEELDSSLAQVDDGTLPKPKKHKTIASSIDANDFMPANDGVAAKRKHEVADGGGGRKKRKGFY